MLKKHAWHQKENSGSRLTKNAMKQKKNDRRRKITNNRDQTLKLYNVDDCLSGYSEPGMLHYPSYFIPRIQSIESLVSPRMTARVARRALVSTKCGLPRPPTVGERGPTGIAARWNSHSLRYAPLRCAPLRLSAITYGGPLVCRLYYFVVAKKDLV